MIRAVSGIRVLLDTYILTFPLSDMKIVSIVNLLNTFSLGGVRIRNSQLQPLFRAAKEDTWLWL